MENSPRKPEDKRPEVVKPSKKKTKSAEVLGGFAVDPEPLQPAAGKEEPESIWDKLTLTKRSGGETEEVVPLAQVLHQEEASRSAEVSEAYLEQLTPQEEQLVARELIATEKQVEHGPVDNEDRAEGAALSAEEMVEAFRHKIINDGESVDQAFEETVRSLTDAPEAETPVEPSGAGEPDRSERVPVDAPPVPGTAPLPPGSIHEYLPPSPIQSEEAASTLRRAGVAPEATAGTFVEPDDDTPGAPASSGSKPLVPAAGFIPGISHSETTGLSPGHAPPGKEKVHVPYYNDSDVVGAALLGGIVGYLIGRRRGRIKTERKLRPVQKKLEKQVTKLKEDIQQKEFYIRKVARQQVQDRQRIHQMEQIHDKSDRKVAETRAIAPEANQLHGKKVTPERIGQVLVAGGRTGESRPAPQHKPEKELEKIRLRSEERPLATMSRAELLRLSEKVTVENTTLRQVYETHLVSEQGLRRLVEEYVRGGDVQRALRHELVEHEIDFERDPILRDKTRPSAEAAASSATLNELLQKADAVSEAHSDDELAVLKARQAHHETQRHRQQKSRRLLDISMITAIAVLFAIVVMLLLEGR